MAQPVIQTSFHAGEWAPALNARVDLAKYHSAAAKMLNYFVDYRGGASTRMGTEYILQAFKSNSGPVRLIGFQASAEVGYVLEFGDFYVRFFNNGAAVLEDAFNITGITQANPGVIAAPGNNYSVEDWFFVEDVGGMTQVNNRFFRASAVVGNNITLSDLNGVPIDTSSFSAYTAGGTVKRVYTLPSPYQADQLSLIKFAQNVTSLYLCHPDHPVYVLTLISATNWTLSPVPFGPSITAPTGIAVATTLSNETWNYSYTVTAVDGNGQESSPGSAAALANKQDIRANAGTNRITWAAVSGADSYNVYAAILSKTNAVASGAAYGFIGSATGVTFDDSNVVPDFQVTPPIIKNPFSGAGVDSVTITNPGTYTTVPGVTFSAAPSGGGTATGVAVLQAQGTPTVSGGTLGTAAVGDVFVDDDTPVSGVAFIVASVDGGGNVVTWQPVTFPGSNPGAVTSGSVPTNPVHLVRPGVFAAVNANIPSWGVGSIQIINEGAGYLTAPTVTFSAGAAAGTAVLDPAGGNPTVPAFLNQRFVLAGPLADPQRFDMSQPGSFTNFNISDPIQPDNAITGRLISGQLNEIKSMTPMQSGLIVFSNRAAWQIYGASAGQAVSAVDITAQTQAYNGASDVPPIVANFDILYVQSKGSSVRDLAYNFYTNIFTGTDISVLSSHLFYDHSILEWAWAEEPFKVVWAVRNDGELLSLTFLKEQDLIGWAHHDTQGAWKSVACVTEIIGAVGVDATYLVAERVINGNTVKYIERMADRFFTSFQDPWCVDSGLRYDGVPATTFSGAEHLIGAAIVGLADGIPFTATVSSGGTFTLGAAASIVTAGLAFTPDLQTLAIDLGQPTAQSKQKKIPAVTIRCEKTLGLSIGSTFGTLVRMKDLSLGNVGSMTDQQVTDLVTGDVRTVLDPDFTTPGQYCIRQTLPYPATILGVMPEIAVGDTK